MKKATSTTKKVKLQNSKSMPALGLGTWKLTKTNALNAISLALEIGYRMIDTSSDYNNFKEVRTAIKNSGISRKDLFITTKVEETDNSYQAAKKYVKQLGLDYADLIIIHRPPKTGAGEKLWKGLIKARNEGVANSIGVSNYSISQMMRLFEDSNEWPAINQIEWTPFGYSQEMLNFCREHKIFIQAYSPLAHGDEINNELINKLAKKYHKSPSQVVLRWDAQQGVVPIPKATQREHLQENIDIFDFELTQEDMSKLDELNRYYSALGSLTYI